MRLGGRIVWFAEWRKEKAGCTRAAPECILSAMCDPVSRLNPTLEGRYRRPPGPGMVGALLFAVGCIVQGCSASSPARTAVDAQAPAAAVSFAGQIAPIFEARCSECHGETNPEVALNLSTYESAMVGSEFGTVIEAGDPDGSFIIDMITSGDMPAEGDPMPPEELELLRSWIAEGAENN